MPKFRLKIVNRATRVSNRFKDAQFIQNLIDKRVNTTQQRIFKMITSEVEKAIKKNKVMRALISPQIGIRGYDLAAEFGLRPGQGEQAYYLILLHLLNTCVVKVSKRGRISMVDGKPSVAINVKTSFLDPKDYENKFKKKPFSYPSKKKKRGVSYRIDWMQWLLEAHRGDRAISQTLPNIKNYGIAYELPGNWKRQSRSGRALMIPEYRVSKSGKKISNHAALAIQYFPYQFPKVAIPAAGYKNFIEEVSKNPVFTAKLQARLDVIIRNFLVKR